MTAKPLIWFAALLILSGCPHDFDLMKMDEQVSGYGNAIRWSLFKRAVGYLDPAPRTPPDWKMLSETKITGYTTQSREVLPSGKVMMQTVEVHYMLPGSVVEKTLIDAQRWRLDEGSNRWVLETGLPAFN